MSDTTSTATATNDATGAAQAAPAAPVADAPLLSTNPAAANPQTPAATETKPEGEKPAAETKPENAVPEKYEIALPEGAVVDDARMSAYQGTLKEAGLTQAQADKLTPFLLNQMEALRQEQIGAWADQVRGWRTAIETDTEFGGAKLNESLALAAKARDAFGGAEFKTFLGDSNLGVGNNPQLFRFMAAVGRAMGEDTRGLERQLPAGAGAERDKSPAAIGDRWYPNMR